MSRRHLPLLGAAALLAVAALLALLARDVRAWDERIAEADQSFQVTPGKSGLWTPDELALGGLSRRLLGVEDDLRFRRAAQLFRNSRPRFIPRNLDDISRGSSAQVLFGQIQRGDYPDAVRSMAANELGVLAFVEALSDPTNASALAKRAVQKFSEAVKLDPANEAAAVNLELILTLLNTDDSRLGFEDEALQGGAAGSGAGSGSGGSGL